MPAFRDIRSSIAELLLRLDHTVFGLALLGTPAAIWDVAADAPVEGCAVGAGLGAVEVFGFGAFMEQDAEGRYPCGRLKAWRQVCAGGVLSKADQRMRTATVRDVAVTFPCFVVAVRTHLFLLLRVTLNESVMSP